jgi:hypothetical protein
MGDRTKKLILKKDTVKSIKVKTEVKTGDLKTGACAFTGDCDSPTAGLSCSTSSVGYSYAISSAK